MKRIRLDQRVVELGLVESREKAQRLIRAGGVTVDGRAETKPSHEIDPDAAVVLQEKERFVSRGGEKLEGAFRAFSLDVTGRTCVDVGASTGGFTDCLLQHGAARVYAVDVGRGQLHWKLRTDLRVVVLDEVNARYLAPTMFPDRPDFATVDVAFISLEKILPALFGVLTERAELVTLIKPQFEAGREQVGRGGVVKDPLVHAAVTERIRSFGVRELGLLWCGVCESPLKGPAGNTEFLAYWKKGEK
jgi:23S rRNA (cytidine1920-2'-O)/16S rRNA (cytidine1409-2'-O)-methyltransferase